MHFHVFLLSCSVKMMCYRLKHPPKLKKEAYTCFSISMHLLSNSLKFIRSPLYFSTYFHSHIQSERQNFLLATGAHENKSVHVIHCKHFKSESYHAARHEWSATFQSMVLCFCFRDVCFAGRLKLNVEAVQTIKEHKSELGGCSLGGRASHPPVGGSTPSFPGHMSNCSWARRWTSCCPLMHPMCVWRQYCLAL